jgi:ethanolamine ammonia-lyase large subunit
MYFETGQGSALSANAHHGVDQQTWRRAPMRWRAPSIRFWSTAWSASSVRNISMTARKSSAPGLEDHFCGKLLGLPIGVDVCYTNHAEADQDDMDNLLTLLAAAGVTFIMGCPAPTTSC